MGKLNFLLIMPRIVNKVGDGYLFPLGLPYISAALKKAGFCIYTYNLNNEAGEVEELVKAQITEHKIDVVLTGGLSFQYYPIKQLVDAVKSVDDKIPVFVGGGLITGDPEAAMAALENCSAGIIGEGEVTDTELCYALEHGAPLEQIDGLIIPQPDGSFLRTKERKEIENLDEIPWPDYEGFGFEKSFDTTPGFHGLNTSRTIFMIGSRSCPFSCSFCFHTVGKKYRQRSLDDFFAELDYNVKKYQPNNLYLADELFSYNTERVLEFCRRIKPYHITWSAQFRVDMIDPELLPIIKDAGCSLMMFGLESADNTVLESMNKHITVEQIEQTLETVYDADIGLDGSFIFGDDAETYKTAMNTLNWWEKYVKYKINLNMITVFPGCALYRNAKKSGLITDPVQYLKDGCPQINNTKMTLEEYRDIIERIMQYPVAKAKHLEELEWVNEDYGHAQAGLWGTCPVCGKRSHWEPVRLININFLICPECGQKYNVVMPQGALKNLGENIRQLCGRYGKLAVWGINYHISELFKSVEELNAESVFPVDSSQIKQQLTVGRRKVYSPKAIREEKIPVVVVAVPPYYNQIKLQIKYQYPEVERVIDICSLLGE